MNSNWSKICRDREGEKTGKTQSVEQRHELKVKAIQEPVQQNLTH